MSEQQHDGLGIPAKHGASIFDVRGHVAVITGGGSGLGRALGIGYAQVAA